MGKTQTCLQLFATFFKIGAFTFGGGYAMIPLIKEETVDQKHWIEESEILDVTALAESTPGPIAVNSATFIGYKTAGKAGAFCATLGVVLPSFLIIYALSFVLRQVEDMPAVKWAFFGIRSGVLALIIKALCTMYRQCPKSAYGYVVMAGALAVTALTDLNVLWVIALAAASGLLLCRKEEQE